MKTCELFEDESLLTIADKLHVHRDLILPTASNIATSLVLGVSLATYGLIPLSAVAAGAVVSGTVGLAVGAVAHFIKSNQEISKMYDAFTGLVLKRDIIVAVRKKLGNSYKQVYKVATRPVLDDIGRNIKDIGYRLIKKISDQPESPERNHIDSAVRRAIKTTQKINEADLNESVFLFAYKGYQSAQAYFRKTATARVKRAIESIKDAPRDKIEALVKRAQEFITWDFYEGRISEEEYARQTIGVQYFRNTGDVAKL
tara:strand:- start:5575 stop:6345 length:771 start_codon:yes stop_codon:yes gene_type:complete